MESFMFYFQVKKITDEEVTEALLHEKIKLKEFISKTQSLPQQINFGELITFKEIDKQGREVIKDTIFFNDTEKELLPYRQLFFNVLLSGRNYEAIISKPLFEADDLIEAITKSFIFLAFILILILLTFNYFFSKKSWSPFFKTLSKISAYQIEKHQALSFENTKTREFQELNEAINKMTSKISADFQNLKEFTENASHELQTPLAIIKTKTENLLQTQGLNEEQTKQIIEINQTANRLRKLNQTLLLLAKIENNQFTFNEETDLSGILKSKLELYEDLSSMKQLKINVKISENVKIKIHPVLADIIVSNLLTNAIKYTPEGGKIDIELSQKNFRISNSGTQLISNSKSLFERFYKENTESDSTGLGLALIKQIADINGHKIIYSFQNNAHHFIYMF